MLPCAGACEGWLALLSKRANYFCSQYWDLMIVILVIVNAWAIPVDVANYFGAFDDDSETSLVRTPPQSRRRCGRGKPSPGADAAGVAGVSPVQMWLG